MRLRIPEEESTLKQNRAIMSAVKKTREARSSREKNRKMKPRRSEESVESKSDVYGENYMV